MYESERLIFRKIQISDVTDKYVAWLNDPTVNRFLEVRLEKQTKKICENYVKKIIESKTEHLMGIFDKKNNNHIGNIRISNINQYYLSAELGVLIGDKSYWGKGYGVEAIKTTTKWAFEKCGLRRLEAGCIDLNVSSLRAFMKCGYRIEGYFRKKILINDTYTGGYWMALLKEEDEN